MNIYSPEQIKALLFKRFEIISKLISIIEKQVNIFDDDECKKNIYIKYYLDFSTAIESLNRNIVSIKFQDKYVRTISKVDDDKQSYFINVEAESRLVQIDGLFTISDIKKFYEGCFPLIKEDFYNRNPLDRKIIDLFNFESCYNSIRITRNGIAHGLGLHNVHFDNDTLFKYMVVFFQLYNYYCSIYIT